jgi:hypothetical protein
MPRKALPIASPRAQKLGAATIMDRDLAAQHGVPYVHAVAFAIDVDRVRAAFEEALPDEDALPFGWEVFLTACFLRDVLDPAGREPHRMLVEDLVSSVVEAKPRAGPEAPLGGQVAFAVYELVRRGDWPAELAELFRSWRKKPDATLDALATLWADAVVAAGELAHACLQCDLDPPPAPPTQEAWGRYVLAARAAGDDA